MDTHRNPSKLSVAIMGHLINFHRNSDQKQLKKMTKKKVQSSTFIQSAERLGIEFKVACNITEPVELGKIRIP